MNTRGRIDAIAAALAGPEGPGLRDAGELLELVEVELGHAEALDRPVPVGHGGVLQQAMAPGLIYHICASNLAVSAGISMVLGAVLGGRMVFKTPSAAGDVADKLRGWAVRLPEELGSWIKITEAHDSERMRDADAVVVFGSDRTVAEVRRQCHWRQRFLAYGHKISAGVIPAGEAVLDTAERAVEETCAYDQSGCLSPQGYLCANAGDAARFGELLAEAFETRGPFSAPPSGAAADIREARMRAHARGDRVLGPDDLGWTVIVRRLAKLEAGPGYRCVDVMAAADPATVLAPWRGMLSAVSVSGRPSAELVRIFAEGGAGRVCRTGELQKPPLVWKHDGRPRLGDLVRWITVG